MYNLDAFYETISIWFRESFHAYKPAVIYPYPFGSEDPDHIVFDSDYEFPDTVLLLYDQEPIRSTNKWLDHWAPTLQEWGCRVILISSQISGGGISQYIEKYNWDMIVYQHHWLASRDWFRSYMGNPFLQDVKNRKLKHHFSCYNRLFSHEKPHRVKLLADFYDNNLLDKVSISFPSTDPFEQITYADITGRQDIQDILPLVVDDPLHTNGSSSIDVKSANTTGVQIVTETIFDTDAVGYITEKSFKPFVLKQPFVMFAPAYTLATLKDMGFQTFDSYWDESYDLIEDAELRYNSAWNTVKEISNWDLQQLQSNIQNMQPLLDFNYDRFYWYIPLEDLINNLFTEIKCRFP